MLAALMSKGRLCPVTDRLGHDNVNCQMRAATCSRYLSVLVPTTLKAWLITLLKTSTSGINASNQHCNNSLFAVYPESSKHAISSGSRGSQRDSVIGASSLHLQLVLRSKPPVLSTRPLYASGLHESPSARTFCTESASFLQSTRLALLRTDQ